MVKRILQAVVWLFGGFVLAIALITLVRFYIPLAWNASTLLMKVLGWK